MSKLSYEGMWDNGGMAPHIFNLDICLCWFILSENIPVIHSIGGGVGRDIRSQHFEGEKNLFPLSRESRDSSAGIVTRLWKGRSWVRIPAEASDFSLIQNLQTGYGANPASFSMDTGFHSRG